MASAENISTSAGPSAPEEGRPAQQPTPRYMHAKGAPWFLDFIVQGDLFGPAVFMRPTCVTNAGGAVNVVPVGTVVSYAKTSGGFLKLHTNGMYDECRLPIRGVKGVLVTIKSFAGYGSNMPLCSHFKGLYDGGNKRLPSPEQYLDLALMVPKERPVLPPERQSMFSGFCHPVRGRPAWLKKLQGTGTQRVGIPKLIKVRCGADTYSLRDETRRDSSRSGLDVGGNEAEGMGVVLGSSGGEQTPSEKKSERQRMVREEVAEGTLCMKRMRGKPDAVTGGDGGGDGECASGKRPTNEEGGTTSKKARRPDGLTIREGQAAGGGDSADPGAAAAREPGKSKRKVAAEEGDGQKKPRRRKTAKAASGGERPVGEECDEAAAFWLEYERNDGGEIVEKELPVQLLIDPGRFATSRLGKDITTTAVSLNENTRHKRSKQRSQKAAFLDMREAWEKEGRSMAIQGNPSGKEGEKQKFFDFQKLILGISPNGAHWSLAEKNKSLADKEYVAAVDNALRQWMPLVTVGDDVFHKAMEFYVKWAEGKLLGSDGKTPLSRPGKYMPDKSPGLQAIPEMVSKGAAGQTKMGWLVRVPLPPTKKKTQADDKFFMVVKEPDMFCWQCLADMTDVEKLSILDDILALRGVTDVWDFLFGPGPPGPTDLEYSRRRNLVFAVLNGYHGAPRESVSHFLRRLEHVYFTLAEPLTLENYKSQFDEEDPFDVEDMEELSDSETFDFESMPLPRVVGQVSDEEEGDPRRYSTSPAGLKHVLRGEPADDQSSDDEEKERDYDHEPCDRLPVDHDTWQNDRLYFFGKHHRFMSEDVWGHNIVWHPRIFQPAVRNGIWVMAIKEADGKWTGLKRQGAGAFKRKARTALVEHLSLMNPERNDQDVDAYAEQKLHESGDRGSGMGPMFTLLTGAQGAGGDPSHLSPACMMDVPRTVLVEHSSRSQGGVSVTMQNAREDRLETQRPSRSSSACTSSHSRPPMFSTSVSNEAPHTVLNGRVTTTTAAESPRVIERIIARYSRMRTDVQRDDGGDANADGEDVAEDGMDGDDESEEDDEPAVKEVTSKGGKKKTSKSRGSSKAREEGGGCGWRQWGREHAAELAFGRIARPRAVQEGPGRLYGEPGHQLRTDEDEDMQMERNSEADGPAGGCEYRSGFVHDEMGEHFWVVQKKLGQGERIFYLLTSTKRKELGFKFAMARQLYDAIHATTPNNQVIHPPNLLDTGRLPPQ
ncbi:hypothetical protein CBR_g461 [Chara braunii]|uniref:Uncharacterized protein n=1 Tax=Chara braunii TaxID=69332 RepID=A0A388KB86_CHABU|nr:hypothetical protein CBR_g461 [Chara braunii]|eukprot:GBG67322.1 hypothetical protein CBR_g461 [Chara braunii]